MAEVVPFTTAEVGPGYKIDADEMLENNKGKFVALALVGQTEDGEIIVAGTDGAGDTVLLLDWAKSYLVQNLTVRV